MAENLAPRLRVGETGPKVKNIQGASTSTFAVLGIFEKGPVGVPTFCAGPEDVLRIFGSPIANGLGAKGLALVAANGNKACYVTRIVHMTDINDASSSTAIAAFKMIDDRVPNAGQAASGSVKVVNNAIEVFAKAAAYIDILNNTFDAGDKVTVNGIDFTQGVGFFPGATLALTATALKDAINASTDVSIQGVVVASVLISNPTRVIIEAVVPGTAGNAITLAETDGATDNFSLSGSALGGGTDGDSITVGSTVLRFGVEIQVGASDIATAQNIQAVVNPLAAVSASIDPSDPTNVLISAATVGVAGNSIALTKVDGDNDLTLSGATLTGGTEPETESSLLVTAADGPGKHANGRQIKISAAKNALATHFRLDVVSAGGVVLDSFDNVNLIAGDENHVEARVNGKSKKLIAVVDQESSNTTSSKNLPAVGLHALAGGNDGLVGLSDLDFIGSESAKTGMYAWKNIEGRFALAACWDRPTVAVQKAGLQYAEAMTHFLWVTSMPNGLSAQAYVAFRNTNGLTSDHGWDAFPNLVIADTTAGAPEGSEVVISNSAAFIGRCGFVDNATGKGVSKAPAGINDGAIKGIIRLESEETQAQEIRDLLFPEGVNPIWSEEGVGPYIDGARVSKLGGTVDNVNERRVYIYLKTSIKNGLKYLKHENIDEAFFNSMNGTVTTFLDRFWRQGGLKGAIPQEAFVVDTSFGPGTLNPIETQNNGEAYGRAGIATKKPGYFIYFDFSPMEEEAAA